MKEARSHKGFGLGGHGPAKQRAQDRQAVGAAPCPSHAALFQLRPRVADSLISPTTPSPVSPQFVRHLHRPRSRFPAPQIGLSGARTAVDTPSLVLPPQVCCLMRPGASFVHYFRSYALITACHLPASIPIA